MNTQKTKVIQNFINALNKAFGIKFKNEKSLKSEMDFCLHSESSRSANSLCLGQTKGFADFLPNQSWQWFTSI